MEVNLLNNIGGGIGLSDKKTRKNTLIYVLLFFLTCTFLSGKTLSIIAFPSYQNMAVGDKIEPYLPIPPAISKNLSFQVNSSSNSESISLDTVSVADTPGEFHMQVKLFGLIPIRDIVLNVVPRLQVIPGGQSIGILFHANGVIVVGHADIETTTHQKVNPAIEAGVKVGDILVEVNNHKVEDENQLQYLVETYAKNNENIKLKVKRNNKHYEINLKPEYCIETKRHRLGLFVKDTAAGVGTLSFYHSNTRQYGALGHMISNVNSSEKMDLADGCIVGASIQAVHPGKKGQPGEKIGLFDNESEIIGNILENTKYGIFGVMEKPIINPIYKKPIPVALTSEVKPGPATMLTVLGENTIEEFNIEILQVLPHSRNDGKGLVLRITDEKLIQKTGGIIQGMSGSPIIQNNKLVGAVTHVFVNNPQKGYGIMAQWMLEEAELLSGEKEIKNTS